MGHKLNLGKHISLSRKRQADFYVVIQFLSLGLLLVLDLFAIKIHARQYVLFEVLCVTLAVLVIGIAAKSLQPSLQISPLPKINTPLIQSGIYKYVRHPMYLGVILIGLGMASYSESVLAWGLEFILLINLNLKARFEDKLLKEIHPESWHYQLHTSRIFPCTGQSCRQSCAISN